MHLPQSQDQWPCNTARTILVCACICLDIRDALHMPIAQAQRTNDFFTEEGQSGSGLHNANVSERSCCLDVDLGKHLKYTESCWLNQAWLQGDPTAKSPDPLDPHRQTCLGIQRSQHAFSCGLECNCWGKKAIAIANLLEEEPVASSRLISTVLSWRTSETCGLSGLPKSFSRSINSLVNGEKSWHARAMLMAVSILSPVSTHTCHPRRCSRLQLLLLTVKCIIHHHSERCIIILINYD